MVGNPATCPGSAGSQSVTAPISFVGPSCEPKMSKPKRATSKRTTRAPKRQYAAIPIRINGNGKPKVMLLTSRGTKRWVIPKGWPIRKLGAAGTAAREAYEEAGLKGRVRMRIGRYRYRKPELSARVGTITVKVFLLEVTRQVSDWPEQRQRKTRWFKPRRAAALVAEPELAALLARIPKLAERLVG